VAENNNMQCFCEGKETYDRSQEYGTRRVYGNEFSKPLSQTGKNNDVDESRFLIPDSIIELIVEIGFMLSPTTIKRVLIFLVAFLWSLFFGFLFIESLLEYFN
jgi:hypothetical protein